MTNTWHYPPVAGVKVSSDTIAQMSDAEIVEFVESNWRAHYFEHFRSFATSGYASQRDKLKLDWSGNEVVLDFGAGMGFDALSHARMGRYVIAADIVRSNLKAVRRVLSAYGYLNHGMLQAREKPPIFPNGSILAGVHIFSANGVLHHSIYAREILEEIASLSDRLREIRLGLYTDKLFEKATDSKPTLNDVRDERGYNRFRWFTNAGDTHSDWYSADKLSGILPAGWTLDEWTECGPDGGYAIATALRSFGKSKFRGIDQ